MEAVQRTLSSPVIRQTTSQVEAQSLNAIVAGFGFASAIAWMDVVRALVSRASRQAGLVSNGGTQSVLIALLTTLLSVVVFTGLSRVSSRVTAPAPVVYSVGN